MVLSIRNTISRWVVAATLVGMLAMAGMTASDEPIRRAPFEVPEMTPPRQDVAPFEYVEVGGKIPNYPPGLAWGAQGNPQSQMQKPLPPEESAKHYVTPKGFRMSLFASDKVFGGKPIAMNWDDKGRLWVAETKDYPNEMRPPGEGNDSIRVIEDTNGDGVADKSRVFAEKLSIPTALVSWRDGIIAQDGARTIFLKDRNGDGMAEEPTVLITGWAMGDTHGGVSNFRYGHDNWIWAMQGYNPSKPRTADGKETQFSMGFFRFRLDSADPPKVTDIEFVRSTNNNSWGLGFSEEGYIFGSSANGHPSFFVPFPNRYLERVKGWSPSLQADSIADSPKFKPITSKVRQVDHHGAYSAAAGHALYTARNYPKAWWNRTAFVCGPEGHLVGTFVLSPDGTTFRATSPCNLVASDDEWSAPIMAEVGPDGNVWILDWYNYIVQHNPTPVGFKTGKGNAYETDLRDKSHGRIYRLLPEGEQDIVASHPPKWESSTPSALLTALEHPNMFWRLTAQRLLIERGRSDVVNDLVALLGDTSVDELNLAPGALHAIWTLEGLGEIGRGNAVVDQAITDALDHPSSAVRRAALMTMAKKPSPETTKRLSKSLIDPSPQVALAALLAIADASASNENASVLLTHASALHARSAKALDEAFIVAACVQGLPFLRGALTSKTDDPASLEGVVSIAARHWARTGLDSASLDSMLQSLRDAHPSLVLVFMSGLMQGWPSGKTIAVSEATEQFLIDQFPKWSSAIRASVLQLADRIACDRLQEEAKEMAKAMAARLLDESVPGKERLEAARILMSFQPRSESTIQAILSAITLKSSPEFNAVLIEELRKSDSPHIGPKVTNALPQWTPSLRKAGIAVLLSRANSALHLLAAIEKGAVSLEDLSLDQRQLLAAFPNQFVATKAAKLFARGGGLANPDRQNALEAMLPLAERQGDVDAGKLAFKKYCAKCHRHGSDGDPIGPDLTGMAVHSKREMLLNIVDPSRNVEANFRVYTVATQDGVVRTGVLAAESQTTVELIDADAKKHSITREDIDELIASRKSLMPDGFEKQMAEQEIVDLLEFLAHRGKYTPLDLRKVATVVTTRGMLASESAERERLVFPDWQYKVVDGVPFALIDPLQDQVPNAVMIQGGLSDRTRKMPTAVNVPVGQAASRIHILGGINGGGFPVFKENSISLIVRIRYADGPAEEHSLRNGIELADFTQQVDVAGSKLAFKLQNQQVRYLSIAPLRESKIESIELVKGMDHTSPIVLAITAEAR